MKPLALGAVDRGIPRRLSASPDDRFFDQGLVARMTERVAVMLDGVELAVVTSWDVDKGEITRPRRNAGGTQMLDESGTPAFERLRGTVEVRWLADKGPSPDRPNGSAGRTA